MQENHLQVLTVFNFWTTKYFLQRISYDTITIKYVNHDSFNQCFVVSSFELSIEVQPLNDFTHSNYHTVLHTMFGSEPSCLCHWLFIRSLPLVVVLLPVHPHSCGCFLNGCWTFEMRQLPLKVPGYCPPRSTFLVNHSSVAECLLQLSPACAREKASQELHSVLCKTSCPLAAFRNGIHLV